jgi:hypothetical protein
MSEERPKFAKEEKKFAPLGGFDKNLTIEKAKYNSSTSLHQQPTTSASTPISPPSPPQEEKPPPLTTSVTLPIVTTLQSVSGPSTPITPSSNAPSQSTPLTKTTKPKTEVIKVREGIIIQETN